MGQPSHNPDEVTHAPEPKPKPVAKTVAPERIDAADALDRLFANLPTGEPYWAKLYRHLPQPQPSGRQLTFLYHFDSPETVEDWEIETARLAQAHDWGVGEIPFQLRTYNRNGPKGYISLINFVVTVPGAPSPAMARPATAEAGDGSVAGLNQVIKLAETAKVLKELLGGAQGDMGQLTQILQTNMKTGVDIARDVSGGGGLKMDDLLKGAGAIASALKEAGLIGKQPDFIEQLKALRESGLMEGPEKPEDRGPASELARLRELAEVFGPLISGGKIEPPSVLAEAARSLGPHALEIVQNVTLAWRDQVALNKLRLLMTAGTRPGATAPPRPAVTSAPLIAVVREITTGIQRQDDGFFPRIFEAIAGLGVEGTSFLAAAQQGQLSPTDAVALLSGIGVPDLDQPAAAEYVGRFIHWLRAAGEAHEAPPAPGPPAEEEYGPVEVKPPVEEPKPGEVLATCEKCGMEYIFSSWQIYESDSAPCDLQGPKGLCGGTVRAQETQP